MGPDRHAHDRHAHGEPDLTESERVDLPPASDDASATLAAQRALHGDDMVDVDEAGVAALVNNTGLDGDAATG